MEIEPVVMTSAVGLPETLPNSALDTVATLATPPVRRPAITAATSKKNWPPPLTWKNFPISTKRKA